MTRNIWLTASHIKSNVVADKASWAFNDTTEWKLDATIFQKRTTHFGTPEVDMFTSRLNYQMMPFVS
jgi:hypothetical protein